MSLTAYEIIALLGTNLSDELLSATLTMDPSLQDLLALSTHRYTLENCIKYFSTSLTCSLYQKALGKGVQKILDQFMNDLADIETHILEDPSLSPSFIRYRMRTHINTLPCLSSFINDTVIPNDIYGGQLLQLLYKGTQDNQPDIMNIFQILLHHVHQPFFAQLIQWIAYAELQEDIAISSNEHHYPVVSSSSFSSSNVVRSYPSLPSSSHRSHTDFFIQRSSTFTNIIQRKSIITGTSSLFSTSDKSSLYIVSSDVHDGKLTNKATKQTILSTSFTDNNNASPKNELRILANGHQYSPDSFYVPDIHMDRLLQRSIREFEWSRGYVIHYENIPVPYFPTSLAETILSIGKAVGLLRQYGTETIKTKPSSSTLPIFSVAVVPGGEGTDLFGLLSSSSASFTREDSLAVASILASLRMNNEFNLLNLQSVLHRIRDIVYARLWKLIVHEKNILDEITMIRSFYLLGRGDFYQAFLEHSRKVMSVIPSTSPDALNVLRSGPWETAANQANIYATKDTHTDFQKLHLALTFRALRFETYPPQVRQRNKDNIPLNDNDDDRSITGSHNEENSLLSSPSRTTTTTVTPVGRPFLNHTAPGNYLSSLMYKVWQPFSIIGSDRFMKSSRASVPLLILGTAGTMKLNVDMHHEQEILHHPASTVASVTSSHPLDKIVTLPSHEDENATTRDTYEVEKVCLARPTTKSTGSVISSSLSTGAVWLYQPVILYRGFNLRLAVSFPSIGSTGTVNNLETISFGIVIHRDHQSIVLGNPSSGAGYGSIQNSLVIQILGKRLPSTNSSNTMYRIVAAVYGPPNMYRSGIALNNTNGNTGSSSSTTIGNERTLLASGAIMEINLSHNNIYSLRNSNYKKNIGNTDTALVSTILRQLHLCIEYVPPGVLPETSTTTTTVTSTTGKGRLRVTMWDAENYQSSVHNTHTTGIQKGNPSNINESARRLSTQSHGSKLSSNPDTNNVYPVLSHQSFNKSILDVPLTIEEIINFTGIYGPGRGRGYIGLTSESTGFTHFSTTKLSSLSNPSGTNGTTIGVPVLLDSMDFVSYSEADEAYGGFHPEYIPLNPLHLILHSGAMGVYEDFFRVTLRAKAVALGLQETWRLLTDCSTKKEGHKSSKGIISSSSTSAEELPAFEYTQRRNMRSINSNDTGDTNVSLISDGVSAQVTGREGKRDPEISKRIHQRLRLHEIIRPIWFLRSQMQFVVDALLYHLQVDVVETAYNTLQEGILKANDYNGLQYAHEFYLRSLLDGAFLTQPSVSSCIARLLNHCERFISLVSTHQNDLVNLLNIPSPSTATLSATTPTEEKSRTMINDIIQGFATDVRYLETAGSEKVIGLHGADAASLFLRLDFNNFYN